jgi:hypothetical protein
MDKIEVEKGVVILSLWLGIQLCRFLCLKKYALAKSIASGFPAKAENDSTVLSLSITQFNILTKFYRYY